MVDEIGIEAGLLDLIYREVPRELVDDGADHLKMPQLLGADIGQQALELGVGHGVALAQIPQRSAELAVRAAVLADDRRGELRVGVGDLHRILQFLFINKHQSFPPRSHGHGLSSHL